MSKHDKKVIMIRKTVAIVGITLCGVLMHPPEAHGYLYCQRSAETEADLQRCCALPAAVGGTLEFLKYFWSSKAYENYAEAYQVCSALPPELRPRTYSDVRSRRQQSKE